MATPLGNSADEVVRRIRAGDSAAAPPTGFDAGAFDCPFCAEVKDFVPQGYVGEAKMLRLMNRDAQFAVADAWADRGRLALVGMGVEPGASDVFARYAADHLFSHIDEVGVRDVANLTIDGYDFAPTFSIWTTIEECLNPSVIWERERGWYTTEPFSEPEVLRHSRQDGWLLTGDITQMDDEGYFRIIARKADLWYSQRPGQPAFPRDVEEVLYEIPQVKEAAVVAVAGQPIAFIISRKERPGGGAVIAYVRRRLPPELAPRMVIFLDEFPRSFIGKVLRRELARRVEQQHGSN